MTTLPWCATGPLWLLRVAACVAVCVVCCWYSHAHARLLPRADTHIRPAAPGDSSAAEVLRVAHLMDSHQEQDVLSSLCFAEITVMTALELCL